jgi:flagellar export protein FliJ
MKSLDLLIKLHRFKVDEVRRRIAGLEAMVTDFRRQGLELDTEVKAEQERWGISDCAKFAYPSYAHTIAKRRDNLLRSIGELEQQIANARKVLAESHNELKKFEVLEESQTRRLSLDKNRRPRVRTPGTARRNANGHDADGIQLHKHATHD